MRRAPDTKHQRADRHAGSQRAGPEYHVGGERHIEPQHRIVGNGHAKEHERQESVLHEGHHARLERKGQPPTFVPPLVSDGGAQSRARLANCTPLALHIAQQSLGGAAPSRSGGEQETRVNRTATAMRTSVATNRNWKKVMMLPAPVSSLCNTSQVNSVAAAARRVHATHLMIISSEITLAQHPSMTSATAEARSAARGMLQYSRYSNFTRPMQIWIAARPRELSAVRRSAATGRSTDGEGRPATASACVHVRVPAPHPPACLPVAVSKQSRLQLCHGHRARQCRGRGGDHVPGSRPAAAATGCAQGRRVKPQHRLRLGWPTERYAVRCLCAGPAAGGSVGRVRDPGLPH